MIIIQEKKICLYFAVYLTVFQKMYEIEEKARYVGVSSCKHGLF